MDRDTALLALFHVLEQTDGQPDGDRKAALNRLSGLLDEAGDGENDSPDEDDIGDEEEVDTTI